MVACSPSLLQKSSRRSGFQDLVFRSPEGKPYFVEVKSRDKLGSVQERCIAFPREKLQLEVEICVVESVR